jgi:hypothetical protein
MKIFGTVEITPESLWQALIQKETSRDEIIAFIKEIDETIAETDFTLALINGLVKSLKEDGETISFIRKNVGL